MKANENNMKKYTVEEAIAASTEYFDGDQMAAEVWVKKYSLKDSNGNIYEKTPEDMHWRIANELARVDTKYSEEFNAQKYFDLLKDFKYIIPQGSPMAGIGNDFQIVSLSNCFVIGNKGTSDSYGAIMKSDQEQIQLMKRRGGVGQDLSHIRPKGSHVKNSALTSTGVVPFMERYSNSTREVAQDGRRGALMLSINISHPDAEDFIDAKMEAGKVTGANISVKLTDDFMEVVKRTTSEDLEMYERLKPVAEDPEAHIESVKEYAKLRNKIIYTQTFTYNDGSVLKKPIIAKKLWDKIIHNAWKSAEPGVMYWDTIINESLSDCYSDLGFKTISTNPCLTGDTLIRTSKGIIPMKDVVDRFISGESFEILSYNVETGKEEFKNLHNAQMTKENAEIIEIELENSEFLKLTPDHKVYTKEDGWIEAAKLTTDHTLIGIED